MGVSCMSEFVSWTTKAILLPLLPFWSGAFIRYLCLGEFSWRVFGVGELCVSMAVLFLLLSTSAGQITDQALRTSVSTTCYYVALSFFIIFVFSSFIETLDISYHEQLIEDVASQLKSGKTIDVSFIQKIDDRSNKTYPFILNRIRFISLIALMIALPSAYVLRYKYKLEA
jgi:p-aminobenzoyl-glutamate transporter AbgT